MYQDFPGSAVGRSVDRDPAEVATLLYETGMQMCADALGCDRLPQPNRDFLHAWGRLLKETSHWMRSQCTAGVMPDAEIVSVARFSVELAERYPRRSLV